MNVSQQQIEAVERGDVLSIPLEKTDCVIIRKEVFEKIRNALEIEETYPAILDALDDENPDQYLEYLNEK